MTRDPCLNCVLKHIAQARALMKETLKGYEEHVWFAIGHLAEAEDECGTEYPELRDSINHHRKCLEMETGYEIPFTELIREGLNLDVAIRKEQLHARGIDDGTADSPQAP